MSDLRTAAQQALEFLDAEFGWFPGEAPRIDALRAALAQQAEPAQKQDAELSAALGWPGGISNPVLDRKVLLQKVAALRLASQQALEALEEWHGAYPHRVEEDDIEVAEALRAALAEPVEPVQEPAFHGFMSDDGTQVDVCFSPSAPRKDGTYATAYYTAPPQRQPLTEEEIKDCFHAARNAKLGASKDNSKHRLSVVEIARAVERAHGIGETK